MRSEFFCVPIVSSVPWLIHIILHRICSVSARIGILLQPFITYQYQSYFLHVSVLSSIHCLGFLYISIWISSTNYVCCELVIRPF